MSSINLDLILIIVVNVIHDRFCQGHYAPLIKKTLLGVVCSDDEDPLLSLQGGNAIEKIGPAFPLKREPSLLLICHFVRQQFGNDKPTDQNFRLACANALATSTLIKPKTETNLQLPSQLQQQQQNLQARDITGYNSGNLANGHVRELQNTPNSNNELLKYVIQRRKSLEQAEAEKRRREKTDAELKQLLIDKYNYKPTNR